MVLHTWGSALTHHPHVHCIVPGITPDGWHWIACRPYFFLSVRVLSRLFRRLSCSALSRPHGDGELTPLDHKRPAAGATSSIIACKHQKLNLASPRRPPGQEPLLQRAKSKIRG
jgi:hypothetical protein